MLELHEKVIEDLVKFRFNEKTGFIVVGVDHYSPKFAQEFLMLVIKEANEITRNQDITEAKKVTEYLQELLPRTNDVIVKTSLGKLISNNIRTLAIADSRDDYLLKIIDDPYVPEGSSLAKQKINCYRLYCFWTNCLIYIYLIH